MSEARSLIVIAHLDSASTRSVSRQGGLWTKSENTARRWEDSQNVLPSKEKAPMQGAFNTRRAVALC